MVVKAEVAAALVVVKPELTLELLVVKLDHPAQPSEPGELLGLGVGRKVAEPVVSGRLVPGGPLNDQPFLARGFAEAVDRIGGDHTHKREPRVLRSAVGVTERDRLEGIGVKARHELID